MDAKQVKTRRQMTEDRIANNIQKCNDPGGQNLSLFDLELMGKQAASRFTCDPTYNPGSDAELAEQRAIQDVLSRSEI
jgi:hypothetical protein